MTDHRTSHESVGTAAEEAIKLLAAAEEWARGHAGAFLDDEHLATGSVECQVCPVCQGIGVLRNVRPETVQHLFEAGASLAAALRSVVTQQDGHAHERPAERTSPVQRIHLDDEG